MTTVLVTGVGGFVGSHVVEALLERTDWHVIGVDSFRHSGQFENLVAVGGHATSRVTAWVHDLAVPLSSRRVRELSDLELDYVINVASRSHVDESVHEPRDFVLNNVELVLTMLELCRLIEPRRLVHVSTDEVHGPTHGGTLADHRPSSPYAASKAAQLDLVHAYARTYGVPTTVVTSANMFGERQMTTAFVPIALRAITRDQTLYVHHRDGQPATRSYTYVRNVATTIVDELRLVENGQVERPTHVDLPLPGQRRLTVLELATELAQLVGRPLQWREVDGDRQRPGYDPTYATLRGSWSPEVSFTDGLARTVRWYLDDWKDDEPL